MLLFDALRRLPLRAWVMLPILVVMLVLLAREFYRTFFEDAR